MLFLVSDLAHLSGLCLSSTVRHVHVIYISVKVLSVLGLLPIPCINNIRTFHEDMIIVLIVTSVLLLWDCFPSLFRLHRCDQLLQLVFLLCKQVLGFSHLWLESRDVTREL